MASAPAFPSGPTPARTPVTPAQIPCQRWAMVLAWPFRRFPMQAKVRGTFGTRGITRILANSLLCTLLALAGCRGTDKVPAPEPARPVDTVQGPAGSLHVDDGGKGGLPVLFVHGLGGDSGVWEAQLRHLRASRRAVALDLRGHGRSAAPKDGDYAVASVAQDVAAVADALGLKRFVLVGHSWGGLIVCAYAGKHSDRVAGLLFADPAGDLSSLSAKEKDGFKAELSKGDPKANVEGFFSAMLAPAAHGVKDRVMATVRT